MIVADGDLSLSTDVFRGLGTRELDRGRHPSVEMESSSSIGTSSRTRRLKSIEER